MIAADIFIDTAKVGLASATYVSTGATTGQVQLALRKPSDLGLGLWQDWVSVWACSDAAGSQEIVGSRQGFLVNYHVSHDSAPAQGTNMVENGDFSAGKAHWTNWAQHGASMSTSTDSGILTIVVPTIGTYSSDVQVSSLSSLYCVQGKNYRLSFEAWADEARSLETTINENGHDLDNNGFPSSPHKWQAHAITTSKATYTMEFAMPVTNTDAGLLFMAGQSTVTLYIDNVSFTEIP